MKTFLLILIAFMSLKASASNESFQVQNIVGLWESYDYDAMPEARAAVITYDQGSKQIVVTYCDNWKLSTEKVCIQSLNWKESGPYSADVDGFKATFGSLPKYIFRVDPSDKDAFVKTWGQQSVSYRRIK